MNYDSDAKLNVEISQQRIEPCPAPTPTKIRSCCPHPNTHSWQTSFAQQRGQWPHPQLAHQSSMKRLDPSWRGRLARTLIRSLTGRSPKRAHTRRASGRPRSCPAASSRQRACFPAVVPTGTRRFPLTYFGHTPGLLLLVQRIRLHPSSLWS